MKRRIRVLIADDSRFMLSALGRILAVFDDVEVVGQISRESGILDALRNLRPDCLVLDSKMPDMDPMCMIESIFASNPLPVILLCGSSAADASVAIAGMKAGVCDFVIKPSGDVSVDISDISGELVAKIRNSVLQRRIRCSLGSRDRCSSKNSTISGNTGEPAAVIAIGISTGGPKVLSDILPMFPAIFSGTVLVAQHMPAKYTAEFARHLDAGCEARVLEGNHGMRLAPGTIIIAPGDSDMEVRDSKYLLIDRGPQKCVFRPSADRLLSSVSRIFGKRAVGVIMTGMGNDGALGIKELKASGGATIAQNEETCAIFGMPRAAIETGCIDFVLPHEQIVPAAMRLAGW